MPGRPEQPMRAHMMPLDPRRCHCGGWLITGTDGNGRALQYCDACPAVSCVVRLPARVVNGMPVTAGPDVPRRPCDGGCGVMLVNPAKGQRFCAHCSTSTARRARRKANPRPTVCATSGCYNPTTERSVWCKPCQLERNAQAKRDWAAAMRAQTKRARSAGRAA